MTGEARVCVCGWVVCCTQAIAFRNLKYSIPGAKKGDEPKQILKGLNGHFQAGEMTALMGPRCAPPSCAQFLHLSSLSALRNRRRGRDGTGVSEAAERQETTSPPPSLHRLPPAHPACFGCGGCSGAGKTTLLDIISGRKTYGTVEGEVLLGGRKPTPAVQRHQMGYVEQFDTLVATLSVRDMLLYTSELKRPMVRVALPVLRRGGCLAPTAMCFAPASTGVLSHMRYSDEKSCES
jgi:hypothetical protein